MWLCPRGRVPAEPRHTLPWLGPVMWCSPGPRVCLMGVQILLCGGRGGGRPRAQPLHPAVFPTRKPGPRGLWKLEGRSRFLGAEGGSAQVLTDHVFPHCCSGRQG